jgi:hypothetical protein
VAGSGGGESGGVRIWADGTWASTPSLQTSWCVLSVGNNGPQNSRRCFVRVEALWRLFSGPYCLCGDYDGMVRRATLCRISA